jgi:hypothetical protein
MYVLYMLGAGAERMWGPGRFLVMYLISGLGGSCAAAVYHPPFVSVVGASGAICGILGSMAAWVFLNRPYLPQDRASSWMRAIITDVILVAFISLMPGVSGWAHFGGGVAGLASGVPLVYSRFGSRTQRWLGSVAVLLVPAAALGWMYESLRPASDVDRARAVCLPVLRTVDGAAIPLYDDYIQKLLEEAHTNKGRPLPADKVNPALTQVERVEEKLRAALAELPAPGTYDDAAVNAAVDIVWDYIVNWQKVCERVRQTLRPDRPWDPQARAAINGLVKQAEDYQKRLKESALAR